MLRSRKFSFKCFYYVAFNAHGILQQTVSYESNLRVYIILIPLNWNHAAWQEPKLTRISAPNLVESCPTSPFPCMLFVALSSSLSTSFTLRFIILFEVVFKVLSHALVFLSKICLLLLFSYFKKICVLLYVVYEIATSPAIWYLYESAKLLHVDIGHLYFSW